MSSNVADESEQGVVLVDMHALPGDENDAGGKTNEGFHGEDESNETSMVDPLKKQTDEIEKSSMQVIGSRAFFLSD